MKRCYSCFRLFENTETICPYCGREEITEAEEPIYLEPGLLLNNRYIIGESIGAGGFGIIYKAWDTKLENIVAVKEFFASRLVTRAKGEKKVIVNKKSIDEFNYRKDRFLAEAKTMAQFGEHRNIPNVFEFFEENGTAYIVMELLKGMALNDYLKVHDGKIEKDFALLITNEVGRALNALHEKGIIHRDVAPDNIFICSGKDLKIKLLDLGAAKLADSTDEIIDIILKPGFSPYEQYDNSNNIGPWTDVYALGATLYAMITGYKPDESTNRKQVDNVKPPMLIDDSISENLSNAIMKSMAIDKHMRFKTVNEFLKAINGEKKVITLEKERRLKKIKRAMGILLACTAIGIMGFYSRNMYEEKKAVKELKPATISVWYSVEEGSTEESAMNEVIADFKKHYPNVKIESKAIPEEEYKETIEKAKKENKLPNVFESTDIGMDDLKEARDVRNVIVSDQAKESVFLKNYNNPKKVPLGIVVPVAYVITSGNTAIEYQDDYFSSIDDFGEKTKVSIDEGYKDMIEANLGSNEWVDKKEFLNEDKNTSAVLLSSSMELDDIKQNTAKYEKNYVFLNTDKVICDYTYEWSLGNGNENENKASDRLLSWMLGNIYQNTLMISRCNDGQLPINETCFKKKITGGSLNALLKVYKNFEFEKD